MTIKTSTISKTTHLHLLLLPAADPDLELGNQTRLQESLASKAGKTSLIPTHSPSTLARAHPRKPENNQTPWTQRTSTYPGFVACATQLSLPTTIPMMPTHPLVNGTLQQTRMFLIRSTGTFQPP